MKRIKISKKGIQTMALPYANGDLHLGHALESIIADITARIKRNLYEEFYFVCADDTHGTPIEINAMKRNISPEELVEIMHKRHIEDFKRYNISFDVFHDTNSSENKEIVEFFFNTLNDKGLIYKKGIEQFYCESDKRFLPDRFIKGKCPYCHSNDQYGDVCEVCGRTYSPDQMDDYYCVLCGKKPVIRESEHYFFKLSALQDELKEYIEKNNNIQKETKNYVMGWINDGLRDWDISREGPYFGFKIPGEENKYFYVWLDAPIGYLSSLKNLLDSKNKDWKEFWNDDETEIVHVIGKDIMYFHLLFWPATLNHVGLKRPDNVPVHGFITNNGQRMSKSRGNALSARDISDKYETDLFRYYIAAHLNNSMTDIDFVEKKFTDRINHELISNIFNMHYRVLSLIAKRKQPISKDARPGVSERNALAEINRSNQEFLFEALNFNHANAVKAMLKTGDVVNRYVQDQKPWEKEDNGNILGPAYMLSALTLLSVQAIMPNAYEKLKGQYNFDDMDGFLKDYSKLLVNYDFEGGEDQRKLIDDTIEMVVKYAGNNLFSINKPEIVYKRLDSPKDNDADKNNNDGNTEKNEQQLSKSEQAFSKILLRVANIREARKHPDADKLFILKIFDGKTEKQIVTGLVGHYATEDLENRNIVLVDNLKPAVLRNERSEGMLMAGSNENLGAKGDTLKVVLLETGDAEPGDVVYAENQEANLDEHIKNLEGSECDFRDVIVSKITAKAGKALTPSGYLKTKKGYISVQLDDGCEIH